MNLIVITDIFGRSTALEDLLTAFSEQYDTVTVVDPYQGRQLVFRDESEAYKTFQRCCGLEKLTGRLKQILEVSKGSSDIVGFSVGATAAWEITGGILAKSTRKAVCFYGSRIREKTDINPLCPTTLIFPEQEEGFQISELIPLLETKDQVDIIKTKSLHGFMNQLSRNYSPEGFRQFRNWLHDHLSAGRR